MLKVEGVSKRFAQTEALKLIDMTLSEGSILGLVGSNGAGKSTLMRLLCGVYKPDAGSILYDGEPVYDNPLVKEQIAFVPDELYFLPNANSRRMAKFYAGAYRSFDCERFERLCGELKIDPKKPLREFSKGMKRQVAIVLALSCCPRYLFLDEAFDGLDPVKRRQVRALLNDVIGKKHGAVVISSHSLRELEGVCDRLALLHEGELVFCSDTVDLESTCFKVQVALDYSCDRDEFNDLQVLSFEQEGSVLQMIVEGNLKEIRHCLEERDPLLLDILPLNLEEIFLYQLQALGYDSKLLLEDDTHQEKGVTGNVRATTGKD